MLYTWTFAEQACGWSSPNQFDPAVFARATDPSVGAEHCPWSDWHDDKKLLKIAPSGMSIRKKQLWQQGWFVWYELGPGNGAPRPFFDLDAACGTDVLELPPSAFEPAAANINVRAESLEVTTGSTTASYAAQSSTFDATAATVVSFKAELHCGAFSAGVLDLAKDKFVGTCQIIQLGRGFHAFSINEPTASARLIFSNLRVQPAESKFALSDVKLRRRESPSLTFLRERVPAIAS
jgi:hypothetical protein